MAKKLTLANAILCEHVVQGASNKHTLVNVYAGDIVVAALPATLTLGLYAEVIRPFPNNIRLEMTLDGKPYGTAQVTFNELNPNASGGAILVLPLIQMGIDRNLEFVISATAEGFAKTTVIKKRIYLGVVPGHPIAPNVSEPPSEQSPPAARRKRKQP